MKKVLMLITAFIMAMPLVYGGASADKSMKKTVESALEFSLGRYREFYDTMASIPGSLPQYIKDGELVTCDPHWWTSGFFPGTLWYLYEYSGEPSDLAAAEEMTRRVESQQYTTDNHDVGFIINCSYGNGYRLTGNESYRQVLVNAAKSLSTRFSGTVGCTRSWNGGNFLVIIDNMMNLELLTVASALTGDNTFYRMAKSHADKTIECHFRPDASSYHVVEYDPATGEVVKRRTAQGAADESSWSRGQAWGLYGYTMMYRQTGDRKYLDHAVCIGRYIMEHPVLPKDGIPYWDFDAPGIPDADRDASAGAIMASAYIELSTYVDGDLSEQFLSLAEKQLKSLSSDRYLDRKGACKGFLIKHCTGHHEAGSEIDTPLSYGDYYYVEALMRYRRLLEGRPVVDVFTVLSENDDRALWLSAMRHISDPVLKNLADGTLRTNMPVETIGGVEARGKVTHLEAFGRLMTGLSPWLELGVDPTPEGQFRAGYIDLVIKGIRNAVNPDSPDYMNFNKGDQPLVDAAFLAHGLLRCRTQVWNQLDTLTRSRVIAELESSRVIKPGESNWLLFSAMVECALKEFSGEWEYERVQYALERFREWYKGDGWYGDGKEFHLDYYNSFVIHPMLMQVLEVSEKYGKDTGEMYEQECRRYPRYAEQQERLISPEGTYPAFGRSLAYRFGAFYALSDVAYRQMLPAKITPAQVRCGLTEVIRRQINAPGTFDGNGWLRVGLYGHQPSIGETYISTGSLYLCTAAFIALGLPSEDPFWSSPAADWTEKKIWQGVDIPCDHALAE